VESPIHKSRRREHLTDKGGIWNFVLSFFFFFLELKSWVLYLSYTTILRFLAAYENLVSEEEEEQRSRNLPNKPKNSPAKLLTWLDIQEQISSCISHGCMLYLSFLPFYFGGSGKKENRSSHSSRLCHWTLPAATFTLASIRSSKHSKKHLPFPSLPPFSSQQKLEKQSNPKTDLRTNLLSEVKNLTSNRNCKIYHVYITWHFERRNQLHSTLLRTPLHLFLSIFKPLFSSLTIHTHSKTQSKLNSIQILSHPFIHKNYNIHIHILP